MTSLVAGKPDNDKAIHGTTAANKGIHWEYRVFGVLSKEYRRRLESVCTTPPESGSLKDRYLWSPGRGANIKIRRKKLKFKHLLQSTPDGFELWDEGKHLKFKFPLDRSTIEMLEKELCAEAPGVMKAGCNSADELTAGMSLFKPAIKCIVIEKHRSRCSFLYRDTPIQLEDRRSHIACRNDFDRPGMRFTGRNRGRQRARSYKRGTGFTRLAGLF